MGLGLYVLAVVAGLVAGSFASALTWRYPRKISSMWGRSFCPKCKKTISWKHNIPLLSFLLLRGKCANCSKKISARYPILELVMASAFLFAAKVPDFCVSILNSSPVCSMFSVYGYVFLAFLVFFLFLSVSIFVMDLEHGIIPDYFVFLGFLAASILLFLPPSSSFYLHLVSGFGAGFFLLAVHLLTKGKGMGLGDVKLALFVGLLLGWPYVLVWLLIAFIAGGGTGIVLIALGKAKFGKQIAFGPFLILSLVITLIWGDRILGLFFG